MIDKARLTELLLKKALEKQDYLLFDELPYYRSEEGTLSHTVEELTEAWPKRNIGDSLEFIEVKETVVYYKSEIKPDYARYGKVVLQDDKIKYLYESTLSTSLTRYFCYVAYDGTNFEGYQKQPNKRTVQGVIEDALKQVFNIETTIYSSGRTDKGVHAYNQTFHFDINTVIPFPRLGMIIRSYLPDDIELKSIEEKPRIFHSRYDTTSKTYMYHIDFGPYDVTKRNYRWYVEPFNVGLFKKSLDSVLGHHDFRSFTTTTNKNTERTILQIYYEETNKDIKVYIKGDGFMRYMVRNLIMAAYLIATEELTISMEDLLRRKDNTILKQKSDASGLYLYQVMY